MLSVREMKEGDIDCVTSYWLNADPEFLKSMGVDLLKLPSRKKFKGMLRSQLEQPLEQRNAYCLIWQLDDRSVGHSNTNPTRYGEEAYMHLHLWETGLRGKGYGHQLVDMTLPFFFDNLKIRSLYSEPYALNPAPNRTLEKAGFRFVREYTTVPGSINFEQPVKRWQMTHEDFRRLKTEK